MHSTAFIFFCKRIIITLVKSDGHLPFTYISLHSSTNSFVPFAPSTFQNSAGIPSGPITLPTFSAQLHLLLQYLELLGPLNPHLHQAPIQLPSLHSEVSILVIQSLNILLPFVLYLFWFCQQFTCLILYCLTCTVSRFPSRQLSNLCIHQIWSSSSI